jgi:DNA-binding NarL/FixJ family response regulator
MKLSCNQTQQDEAAMQNGGVVDVPAENPAAPGRSVRRMREPIVMVGARVLSRECLARVLSDECNLPVQSFTSIAEWRAGGEAMRASLIVLCQCGLTRADATAEVEALSGIADEIGRCPTVILSDNEDPDLIVHMLGMNVRGYVPTSLSIGVAVQAIELALAGGVYVPASSLIAAHRLPDNSSNAQKTKGLFTARQAAVVEALRKGKANKIIAYELQMRESTVKVHVRNIMKKLHATNRTEVAYIANRLFNGEEPVR